MIYIDELGNVINTKTICNEINKKIKELKNKHKETYKLSRNVELDFYNPEKMWNDISNLWKDEKEKIEQFILKGEDATDSYIDFFLNEYDRIDKILEKESVMNEKHFSRMRRRKRRNVNMV